MATKAKPITKQNASAVARDLIAINPSATIDDLQKVLNKPTPKARLHTLLWRARNPKQVVKAKKAIKRVAKPVVLDAIKMGVPINTFLMAQGRGELRGVTGAIYSTGDAVNHPPHYKFGGIETIDYIEAKKLNYNMGNAVKYISRADHKSNKKQDLLKAVWYLNRELDKMES